MFKIIKENEILIVPINQSLTQKVLLKKLSGGENCFKNIGTFFHLPISTGSLLFKVVNLWKVIIFSSVAYF
jgi:hypothetical protein